MIKSNNKLCNEVQRPIEASLSIHILSIFSLQNNVNLSNIISIHFFAFGGVETAKTHRPHHFNFLGALASQIGFRHMNSWHFGRRRWCLKRWTWTVPSFIWSRSRMRSGSTTISSWCAANSVAACRARNLPSFAWFGSIFVFALRSITLFGSLATHRRSASRSRSSHDVVYVKMCVW